MPNYEEFFEFFLRCEIARQILHEHSRIAGSDEFLGGACVRFDENLHVAYSATSEPLWSHKHLPKSTICSTSQSSLFGVPPTSAKPTSVGSKTSLTEYAVLWSLHQPCTRYEFITLFRSCHRRLKEVAAVTTAEAVTTSAPDVSIDGATAEILFVPAALSQARSLKSSTMQSSSSDSAKRSASVRRRQEHRR
ncbi:hypothetical protein EDB89DRAFT_2008941 [Lactarius sanguifluus]|nr:hypothetical protein EDB89DRAFT_2008941 [Lactarius sanguifluus]